ncbi:hypothetical protein M3I53_32420 [Paraburkholderia sp. CNPSo 3272]|uniref:hypothetical protein n=1 Tax=Paraburkholderia sp. CNPSo 3272 TaxID=2940931 RepID=UPI0020B65369|nr:hypothetical protein [Paraburkholderia sp. CNPSo 3272]MCP3727766.1 hypothetical protein [Paraburkholderia sp. CNPSo 3272]
MTALAGSLDDGQAALAPGGARMSGSGKWVINVRLLPSARGDYGFSVGTGSTGVRIRGAVT